MLILKTSPQKPARQYGMSTVQSSAPDFYEGDLTVGRAKVFLVGSPVAEEGNLAGVSDSQLQVA